MDHHSVLVLLPVS